ncbi:MAG: sigma-70 family RNA polymerase sigma factor [Planctomycetes bacterium]|nr:sigma-70 family RNA polymerase sigma factor [Planctomycetota bacterium]
MPEDHVTHMLQQISGGDQRAADLLLPIVYDQLHALAGAYLRHERAGHTLQTTALVHEAYLKLVDQTQAQYHNRAHFYAVAAQAMRRILVNHARDAKRLKRGGDRKRVELDETPGAVMPVTVDLDALDQSLQRLASLDDRKARTVEMRFFGGMSIEDTAAALGVAPATVKRDWDFARAWLYRDMASGDAL